MMNITLAEMGLGKKRLVSQSSSQAGSTRSALSALSWHFSVVLPESAYLSNQIVDISVTFFFF